jgi:hypothetical protein
MGQLLQVEHHPMGIKQEGITIIQIVLITLEEVMLNKTTGD